MRDEKLVDIIRSKDFTFSEMLDYMKQYKKYDNVTYRDLDRAFKIIQELEDEAHMEAVNELGENYITLKI